MCCSLPRAVSPFGPSTAAPTSTGAEPSSEPAMFATWCCGQCGNSVPSPMISDEPQAFAPRMSSSQPVPIAA